MKKVITIILLALFCICGYAQKIDPVLLQQMRERRDNEKIRVFVIMQQQYDQQRLNSRAAHFTTRASRREFVVNELKQFAEASQYDLRHLLTEMQRNDLVSEPKTLWIANAIYFEATRDAILSLADRSDIMVIGFDEERNWIPDGEENQPADPTREITSNVTQVNANQVWDLGYTGQGIVVAVIDTGVNYNHLDLADHLWDGGVNFPHHGYDVINNDNDPMDDHSHGTHCAGTVCGDGTAGSQTGMAPDATLMCVKCLRADGRGSDTDVINGMQWAVDHGCDVISMSLGGHGHSGAQQTISRNACVNVLAAGVIASIAAGNEGDQLSQYPVPDNIGLPGGCPPPYLDPEQEQNPGGLSCSVCVGAVDSNDQAASFTSHGPRDWSNSDYADYPYTPGSLTEFGLIRPDVCAPGVSIKSADYSSNNGYSVKSGTSMATPCVAGCMALMLSKNIDATPAELCRILEETAVPLSTSKSNIYGYGRIDVLAAINAMQSGPLTLNAFTVNDGQGNNDGNLNAGESVTLNLTLTNDSNIALDGATMTLTTESEEVTITNGTANLPHFGAGQTMTINNMFSFTLSEDAEAKRMVYFRAETFVNGESQGAFRISVMVFGHILRFVEVTVLNDNNGNGILDAGETANLHVTVSNIGNEPALSVVGSLSSAYPHLNINTNNKSFGTIDVNGQASADFNVSLTGSAPESYTIGLSLDMVDANQKHTDVDFELWKKAITLTSDPAEGGTLSGGGYYGQGQTCTITATANPGYTFVKWTLNGSTVSYLSSYTFEITGEAAYVAHFQTVIDGVVIGDGAGRNSYLPTCVFNQYALTQQIYTADELNLEACDITGVSFFNTTISFTRDLTVYMVNTSKTDFNSNTDWILVTEDDKVYSGSFTFDGYSWTTINFDTVFVYDGSSNIALIMDDNSGSMYLYSMPCRVSSTESCQALSAYNLFTNYDPYSLNYSGTQYMEKNQVIFGVAHYDYTVTASANPSNGGTVSGGGGPYYYGYPLTLTATPNEGYVFNNWTKNGEVVSCVSHYNLNVSESAEYVANFQEVTNGFVIGDATHANAYLPTYYYYSLSEQIYTAEEMGGSATEISSVSFYNTGTYGVTRNMNIYMVNTDKVSFEGDSDWIPISENDLVFSGNVTMTARGWVTVYFSTPFVYDGFSNVALVVDDNSNTYNTYSSCRTFDTEVSQALRISGSGTDYDPFNPIDYSGTLMTEKNQVFFGKPSYDYTVEVTVGTDGGGTVSGGGPCYLNQPITLTATANPGYVFKNWTKDGELVSYLSNYNLIVTESASYVANFEMAPEGIVIGDGVCTNVYLPSYSVYKYTLSQQIYTAAEMGGEQCQISSISFFNTGNTRTRNYTIYMVNTTKTTFESNNDWISVSEADQVYNGSFTMTAGNWTTIYFNTPFSYDGVSNLALIVDDNTGSWSSAMSCRSFPIENNQSIYIFSDGTNYDPYNPLGYSGVRPMEKNQVVFGIPSYDYSVTVTANLEEGGSVIGGGPCYLNQPITLTATANPGYVFKNWTKNDEVVSYVSKYNLIVTESANYVANFEMASEGIVIGDGTYSNTYLPTYYYYSLTEQIYTASEMGGVATEISSVSFFNTGTYSRTRNMNIYMVNTDKTTFESTSDWIAVSDDDLVFSGNVTFPVHDWVTINLSTPFNYDGVSNVALIVDDNSNSYNAYTSCRTFDTEGNQALFVYGYGTDYDPYNPSGFAGTLMSVKNQVVLRWPSVITATANPSQGGTISGAGSYAYGTTCTLTATPNTGYYFLNWTVDGEVVSYDVAYTFAVDGSKEVVANFVEGESTCTIFFDLYDSYGNGWSGNKLVVDYGDGNTEELTLPSGSSISYSREIATGSLITLSWITGSSTYQCSFDIKFENGVLIYHGASLNSSFQQELDINCAVATAPRTITTIADPIEGGTVEGAGTYESGTFVTLTAMPNVGYGFCYWSENGQQVSTDANYSFLVSTDRNLVARFSLPINISVATNIGEGGTTTGEGMFYYGNTCTLTATPNEGYLFLHWSKNGEVISCNATYSFSVTEDAEIEAVFMLLEGALIGQGESTDQYLPSNSNWKYTLSQQIYTPNEIGAAGSITSISYYNEGGTKTRNYDIYMVHTDKTAFNNNTDWIPVTEADRVFRGNVVMTKGYWTTIVLDTPFAYDGSSNLAIVIDDNTGSYTGAPLMACRVFHGQDYQAIRVYSDNTNYDPYNPSEYNGTRLSVKNQMILGITSTVAQTIELTEGWNWFSTYIELDPVELLEMLEAELGDNGIQIKSPSKATAWDEDEEEWSGGLQSIGLTNDKTYMVEVQLPANTTMTVSLVGPASTPGDYAIEINPGWNWIGFPSAVELDVNEALAGFEAMPGDQLKSRNQATAWDEDEEEWSGTLNTLIPGQGYMYYSNSTQPKILIFSTTSKGKSILLRKQ